jgi:GNAT superfamily N-acetyltransferase
MTTVHPYEIHHDEYCISTNSERLQIDVIAGFIKRSYWAATRPLDVIRLTFETSLCFGVYHATEQVGFARVVTDYATVAWLCDVFIDESYRGRGLGKLLMQAIMAHPDLQTVRRWTLNTRDAHELYRKFGFTELKDPNFSMEKFNA